MSLTKNQIIIIGIGGLIVLIFVLMGLGVIPGLREERKAGPAITLNFWGVDEEGVFRDLIYQYQNLRPNVQVKYREFSSDRYEMDLINGLAASTGPDIFMIHNTWLPKHSDKIIPLTESQLPFKTFKELYPTIVIENFAFNQIIYALPLYIDTLALFYNKDIFDVKAVVFPPATWQGLEKIIPKLREFDRLGRIQKAAVALGGSNKSVQYATDILNLMMLQQGIPMVAQDFSRAIFAEDGVDSLLYYVKFANPASPSYAWDEKFGYSLNAFSEEKTAMIFSYSKNISYLKEKNPFLSFEVSVMPQFQAADKKINYADYWGLAASNKTQNSAWAWDFIHYLTANKDNSKKYLEAASRPPALRSLIQEYLGKPELGIFAEQSLTARSWPQIDNKAVEESFSKMIESVLAGASADSAINRAEQEITELMERRVR
jgi:multiple sugar transport system substrate-binding protein